MLSQIKSVNSTNVPFIRMFERHLDFLIGTGVVSPVHNLIFLDTDIFPISVISRIEHSGVPKC